MLTFLADVVQCVFTQQVDIETVFVSTHSRLFVFAGFVVTVFVVLTVFNVETVGSGKSQAFHDLHIDRGIGLQVIVFFETFFGIHQ